MLMLVVGCRREEGTATVRVHVNDFFTGDVLDANGESISHMVVNNVPF